MSLPSLFDYLSEADALTIMKLAEGEKKPRDPSILGAFVKGSLMMGAATAASFGTLQLAKKVYEKTQGKPIPTKFLVPAAALLGAGMGFAYPTYKAHELEEIHRAIQAKRNRTQGGVPGK